MREAEVPGLNFNMLSGLTGNSQIKDFELCSQERNKECVPYFCGKLLRTDLFFNDIYCYFDLAVTF